MSDSLLEQHNELVIEMAHAYLDNMELQLGKKYKDNSYEVYAGLTDEQFLAIKARKTMSDTEFADLYTDFLKMKPTMHLKQVMGAFTQSGGGVEVSPVYDEATGRLKVTVSFAIDGKTLERIEGLSEIEDLLLRMDAMIQVDTVLSGADPDVSPAF